MAIKQKVVLLTELTKTSYSFFKMFLRSILIKKGMLMNRTNFRTMLVALLIASGLQTISCMAPTTESLNNLGPNLTKLQNKLSELKNANAQLAGQITPLLTNVSSELN